jgi:hypothetical protein
VDEPPGPPELPRVSDAATTVADMGEVISLAEYRDDPRPAVLHRLDEAVARLDPLVRARASAMSPTVERELRAIAIAVNAGRPRQAAKRAERLAGLLQHPAAT